MFYYLFPQKEIQASYIQLHRIFPRDMAGVWPKPPGRREGKTPHQKVAEFKWDTEC